MKRTKKHFINGILLTMLTSIFCVGCNGQTSPSSLPPSEVEEDETVEIVKASETIEQGQEVTLPCLKKETVKLKDVEGLRLLKYSEAGLFDSRVKIEKNTIITKDLLVESEFDGYETVSWLKRNFSKRELYDSSELQEYYIYFYSPNCSQCVRLKENILEAIETKDFYLVNILKNDVPMLGAPKGTIEMMEEDEHYIFGADLNEDGEISREIPEYFGYTSEIFETYGQAETALRQIELLSTIGSTEFNDIKIPGYPCAYKIKENQNKEKEITGIYLGVEKIETELNRG